jgi:hypothetical protein
MGQWSQLTRNKRIPVRSCDASVSGHVQRDCCPVGIAVFLQKRPRLCPSTGFASSGEVTPPSRCPRPSRHARPRCRGHRVAASRRSGSRAPSPACLLLPPKRAPPPCVAPTGRRGKEDGPGSKGERRHKPRRVWTSSRRRRSAAQSSRARGINSSPPRHLRRSAHELEVAAAPHLAVHAEEVTARHQRGAGLLSYGGARTPQGSPPSTEVAAGCAGLAQLQQEERGRNGGPDEDEIQFYPFACEILLHLFLPYDHS